MRKQRRLQRKEDPDSRIAFTLLMSSKLQDQAKFAAEAGIAASQVSVYVRGNRNVPRKILERAADYASFPRALLSPLLRTIRSFRLATRGWSRQKRVVADPLFAGLLDLAGQALDLLHTEPPEPWRPTLVDAEDREVAEVLWRRLLPRTPPQRVALVEETEEFRTWALSERVAAESIAVAPKSTSEALELAELSVQIAELCPGDERLRCRAQGYAWFHLSNARRFTNDLPGADLALATARRFWEAGVLGDQGLLNEAIVLALEANQHQYRRRFPLALRRIEEALLIDASEIRGKLLFTKARILETLGDSESSTKVLQEAIPYVDEQKDPRTALSVQFQLLVNLCLQNRASEAVPLLTRVKTLAETLGMEADLKRVVWLEGKVAAGVGRAADAENAFEEVRRYFAAEKLGFDYALVCLDLALLLLEQGRTAEVRTLAAEMAWIFTNQGVHREALAALRIFCDAARQDEATAELAQKMIRFLHRSQHDPELEFEVKGKP